MKKGIVVLSFLAVSLFLLNNAYTVSAGTEPSPFQPELNQLHSIELNIATIDKRIGKLPDSTTSPEGAAGQLEAMANKLSDLDARLGDVLLALPSLAVFYDGRDEVIAALNGISSDTGSIIDVAEKMGTEPSPFSEAALAVQASAQTLFNRVESTCHPSPDIYLCGQ